jgi:hypothetical protein
MDLSESVTTSHILLRLPSEKAKGNYPARRVMTGQKG